MAAGDITRIPEAYHIANQVVDGNDVEAVYKAAGDAVARLRKGKGPYFLECTTYRWYPHFLSKDIDDLRPANEIKTWKERCPIKTYEAFLVERGVLTPARLKSIQEKTLRKVEEAYAFALASPYPAPEDALQDVYSV
jgi:pyruvate dehydrogenase E1 component alpha subunit